MSMLSQLLSIFSPYYSNKPKSISTASSNSILPYYRFDWRWSLDHNCAEIIPPPMDAVRIRFKFYKETRHAYGTQEDVREEFIDHKIEKVIIASLSDLRNQCTSLLPIVKLCFGGASVHSPSMHSIIEFLDTVIPHKLVKPDIVAALLDYVQIGTAGIVVPLPPSLVLNVTMYYGNLIVHDIKEKFEKVVDNLEAARRGTCVICLSDFEAGREAYGLPCLHIFHGDCIVKWLEISHSCPVCRCHPMPHAEHRLN